MALYNLIDVLDTISTIINDGLVYADISELYEDDGTSALLYFSAPDPNEPEWSIEYDGIDSLPDNCDISKYSIPTNKACYGVSFKELTIIHQALVNALEYYKECSADASYSPEIQEDIKKSSIKCKDLQTKIAKFLNHYIKQ